MSWVGLVLYRRVLWTILRPSRILRHPPQLPGSLVEAEVCLRDFSQGLQNFRILLIDPDRDPLFSPGGIGRGMDRFRTQVPGQQGCLQIGGKQWRLDSRCHHPPRAERYPHSGVFHSDTVLMIRHQGFDQIRNRLLVPQLLQGGTDEPPDCRRVEGSR